ncbi:hypothetical protein BJV78DRAFT_1120090, partial [Lactifluus subvellereus]
LCYARPAYIPHTDVIVAGLPPKRSCAYMRRNVLSLLHTDILNVLNSSFRRPKRAWYQTHDHHKRMEAARHLSKYVFPREYGLATVFASSAKAHKYSDFADREEEIKKAPASKTPKRVKPALDLLEKIIRRHGECSYKALRDIACPSKLKRPEQAALDSSIILVCPFAQFSSPRSTVNRRVGAHVRGIDPFVFPAKNRGS